MQRFFDTIFAGVALALLWPILALVMVVLKLTGEGEVFFPQSRIGRNGKNFWLYKFATMLKDSPNIGTGTVTVDNDPRVLPVGKFLREYKINELPQLINIIKGDMSLIGPRPQTQRCFNAFSDDVQRDIKKVRPGLAGLGVLIIYNEERMMRNKAGADDFYDNVIMRYKGELEQWYVKNNSISLYFTLIVVTLFALIFKNSTVLFKLYPTIPSVPAPLKSYITPHARRSS